MKMGLRTGYTTGSCAAGAAKAAVLALLGAENQLEIAIDLPGGASLTMPLKTAKIVAGRGVAAIVKDGGDDPDITTGLVLWAEVAWNDSGDITLNAGEGIGRVTLKGLKIPPGEAAINPVPRRMILKNVGAVLPPGRGVDIRLTVPGGAEVAKKTFNPKLGIEGGISILGSTGIVEPMSEEALKESLRLELNVLRERGVKIPVFAFGNYGLHFLRQHRLEESGIVKIGNYLGFMLNQAAVQGFRRLVVAGHLGKMVKVAGGIFQTHSRCADARMEILTAHAALLGAAAEDLERLFQAKTTVAALEIIEEMGLTGIYRRLGEAAAARCKGFTHGEVECGILLFGEGDRPLYMDPSAETFLKEL